jgi:filamentous hemagglutinin
VKYKLIVLSLFTLVATNEILAGRDKSKQNNLKVAVNNQATANAPQAQARAASNQEIIATAEQLGFTETTKYNFDAHGQKVFKRGQTYITYDIDGHIGGFWKKFNDKRNGRLGTFDATLKQRLGE